jgi:hypothetical protein
MEIDNPPHKAYSACYDSYLVLRDVPLKLKTIPRNGSLAMYE